MGSALSKISNDAVAAKTGRPWHAWFAILDAAGAQAMAHKQIAAWLRDTHGLSGWWAQTVSGTYEVARGLRQTHQMPDGFQVSRSRTVAASCAVAFAAWKDAGARLTWPDGAALELRVSKPDQMIRYRATGDGSAVEVTFLEKGPAKTQIVVRHSKLPDAAAAGRAKRVWAAALDKLREDLKGG